MHYRDLQLQVLNTRSRARVSFSFEFEGQEVQCSHCYRGASASAGSTTWTAKSELADYVSFYGFMIFYLNRLNQVGGYLHMDNLKEESSDVDFGLETSAPQGRPSPRSTLILAGYSYGSMIAAHLPEVSRVLKLFENPNDGSAAHEIRLRACHMSAQTSKDLRSGLETRESQDSLRIPGVPTQLGPSASSPVLVGGFESEAVEHRIDQESRRSLDVRRSLDRVHGKLHGKFHFPQTSQSDKSDEESQVHSPFTVAAPQTCYLLISPVLPPSAALATFFTSLSFKARGTEKDSSCTDFNHLVAKGPSFTIYGSKDFFTSAKKLRTWTQRLSQIPGSIFQSHEVDGVGHFWREPGAMAELKGSIKAWEASVPTLNLSEGG
jgi:hypothetical protein